MLISLRPGDPRPIYQQVVDEVRRALVVGVLTDNDPLPSIRQLAVEIKVNPNTVKQAYQELERLGIVYVRRGAGTFVAARRQTRSDRLRLTREVARRAMQDADRHGVSRDDLIAMIRREIRDGDQ
jgi:GntR family transcriptional regulator